MAACRVYGARGVASSSARASAASPRPMWRRSHVAAILVEQQDGSARAVDAGAQAGGLELHQGDEAVHLGLVRHQGGEHAAEAERLAAELGPHPVLARRGRVALIEDEVDDPQHSAQA